jgi:glycosyltransferase involved in cell wall biosynthesis
MRVAVYCPLKPPDHPVPSGDRRMARLLIAALERAGHTPELAARLRSRDPDGDPARQARLADLGRRLAARWARRMRARPPDARPRVWLTYHLYYKAPDWIGPAAAADLGMPYLVAEASLAPKRAGGPWDAGHRQVEAALAAAAAVLTINPADAACLPPGVRQVPLPPFLDTAPVRHAAADRRHWAAHFDADPERPWLIAVAMMRPGAKLASYRALADALTQLARRDWQLLVVGDGPARSAVEAALAPFGPQVRYVGATDLPTLAGLLSAADLCVWPAVDEAYGMALLEAQAAGTPVVAGRVGGVPAIVADGETGLLVPPDDPDAFAEAVAALLDDPDRRAAMGRAAAARVARQHDLDTAAQRLHALLRELAP